MEIFHNAERRKDLAPPESGYSTGMIFSITFPAGWGFKRYLYGVSHVIRFSSKNMLWADSNGTFTALVMSFDFQAKIWHLFSNVCLNHKSQSRDLLRLHLWRSMLDTYTLAWACVCCGFSKVNNVRTFVDPYHFHQSACVAPFGYDNDIEFTNFHIYVVCTQNRSYVRWTILARYHSKGVETGSFRDMVKSSSFALSALSTPDIPENWKSRMCSA